MQAEKRHKTYNKTSHMLLSYYALLLIFFSIFTDTLSTLVPLSQINIALLTAIFGAALIIHGFKFGETARLHRECYLRLQRLIACVDDEKKLTEQYHEIIAGYPNHSDNDYDDLIIDRTLVKNETLHNSKGEVRWTALMLTRKIIRWMTFWLVVCSLVLLPAYFLFSPLLGMP